MKANKIDILLGAICGDVIGSVHEFVNSKTDKPEEINLFNEKCRITDDSILSFATLDALLYKRNFADAYWDFGNKYGKTYNAGFGGMFRKWLAETNKLPYNSFGNGSAMRVSPVPMLATSLTECLTLAKYSAFVTHSHEEGVKGAQCIAGATYLAWNGYTKEYIKDWVERKFLYNLDFKLDEIRPSYKFDETCQGSVPQAIVAFLESEDYEDFLRLGISISGDTDTILAMGGCLAAAYYKEIPEKIQNFVENKLPYEFKELINKAVKFMESNEFFKYYEKTKLKIVNKSINQFPIYANEGDSGFDLRAWITSNDKGAIANGVDDGEDNYEYSLELNPLERKLIHTGIYVELPDGFEGQVRSRSGLALKQGLFVLNSPGTIDRFYTNEVCVILFNSSDKVVTINNGDRIAQFVLCPVSSESFTELVEVENIEDNEKRGLGGLGSTGVK